MKHLGTVGLLASLFLPPYPRTEQTRGGNNIMTVNTISLRSLDADCIRQFTADLTTDERRLFDTSAAVKTLIDELKAVGATHKQQSKSRRVAESLIPFIDGLETYGNGLSILANASDILCPLWGSLRIVLDLAREFGEYFEKLAQMLENIGTILSRLERYPTLYPDNENIKAPMVDIYIAIFEFCAQAKHVFRVGKEKCQGLKRLTHAVGLATALRVLWKPFTVDFDGIKNRISKNVEAVESEAGLAEKELASKERTLSGERWAKAERSQRLIANYIDAESTAKVHEWLAPVNVATNHKAATSLRHASSGSWFLHGDQFQRWLREDNSFLWLHAIPGAGKTILSSSIINYLQEKVQDQTTGLAYFYCDYKDSQKQDPSKILSTILAMLAKQNSGVFENLQDFFLEQLKMGPTFTADFDELLADFNTFIGDHFQTVIIVIDALDETSPSSWETLTDAFRSLHEQCPRLKILVTSRNELPIARAFQGLPDTSIEQADVADDIQNFVEGEVTARIKQRKLKLRDPELQSVIVKSLVTGSKGMFQWVRCQIDALCKLRNDKAIRSALTNLPRTLQETYIRILQRIEDEHPDDVETVQKILTWLVRGIRNLSLEELAEAISIEPDNGGGSMDFDAVDTDPEDMLELLGGLVTVSPDKFVSLAHFSVKEFLVSEDICKTKPVFCVAKYETESALASVCLTYLCYDDFAKLLPPDSDELQEYKFLPYAASAWGLHAKCSEQDDKPQEAVLDLTMRFFQLTNGSHRNFVTWEQYQLRAKSDNGLSDMPSRTPLAYAAWYGLTKAAQQLLEDGVKFDQLLGPFKAAVSRGHAGVVKAIVDYARAQGDELPGKRQVSHPTDRIGELDLGLALYDAAAMGYAAVVEVLLQQNINLDARRRKDRSPLQAAALAGQAEVVRLLLARGASHAIPCKRYGTPLAAAAEKGHRKVVEVLLQAGANPSGLGGLYSSPLTSAIAGKNVQVVHLILEHLDGAKISSPARRNTGPLAMAASNAMDDCLKDLVELGYPVEDCGALYQACCAGNLSTVDLLLDLGADVNEWSTCKYGSAVHVASFRGHVHVLQRLMDAGADLSVTHPEYGNPLELAAYGGHVACVKVLAKAGIDINTGDNEATAVVRAAANGHNAVIEALYDLGLEKGATTDAGNALVTAAYFGHTQTVAFLAEQGVDLALLGTVLNKPISCTPLEAAASNGKLHVVTQLLQLGSSPSETNNGRFGAPLSAALNAKAICEDIVKTLLDAGANPNVVTDEESGSHGFPLLFAVKRDRLDLVKMLVERGADVNLKAGVLITALQAAVELEDPAIFNLLLEAGADVNLASDYSDLTGSINDGLDKGPITALQSAAWHGKDHLITRLVEAGAHLSVDLGDEAPTPPFISALQAASLRGHSSAVDLLLTLGSDPNQKGGIFTTALMAACSCGHLEVVRSLLAAGATTEIIASSFYTSPLMAACFLEDVDVEIVKLLVQHGAEVDTRAGAWGYPLHCAACYQVNDAVVLYLLEQGADVNAVGGEWGTALQVAAYNYDDDMLEALLSKGADPNIQGGKYNTPLQAAYSRGAYVIIRILYRHGALNNLIGGLFGCAGGAAIGWSGKNENWGSCSTLLHQMINHHGFDVNLAYGCFGNALQHCIATRRGDEEYFVEAGAEVNKVAGKYGTALNAAAATSQDDTLDYLLENGADPNLGSELHPNALFAAIRGIAEGQTIFDKVMNLGIDVNEPASTHYGTALQAAALRNSWYAVRKLLKAGAEVNPPRVSGRWGTPLIASVSHSDPEIYRLLLRKGADVSTNGGHLGTALHAAVLQGKADAVDLLLRRGADPNARGGRYGTPLQAACAYGASKWIILMLLNRGAEINATGGKYHTALQAACQTGELETVEMLVNRGADVNKRGGWFFSPLYAAAFVGYWQVVRYLLRNGAEWDGHDAERMKRHHSLTYVNFAGDNVVEGRKVVEEGGDEKEDDGQEEEEEGEEDDVVVDNVEAIPGFDQPWKPMSKWGVVRNRIALKAGLLEKAAVEVEVKEKVASSDEEEVVDPVFQEELLWVGEGLLE
ncbi:ankyrin repeat-containing domain protein [Cercophora samala]|uniref:Ankyrin repeat-containing domain protein n=1 Tax=Cercophora samala TaxID=330535 RepID=A0AA40D816_9PEZI|nr:ankyrin repeat-containing domain protein [Cercophora samala]